MFGERRAARYFVSNRYSRPSRIREQAAFATKRYSRTQGNPERVVFVSNP